MIAYCWRCPRCLLQATVSLPPRTLPSQPRCPLCRRYVFLPRWMELVSAGDDCGGYILKVVPAL